MIDAPGKQSKEEGDHSPVADSTSTSNACLVETDMNHQSRLSEAAVDDDLFTSGTLSTTEAVVSMIGYDKDNCDKAISGHNQQSTAADVVDHAASQNSHIELPLAPPSGSPCCSFVDNTRNAAANQKEAKEEKVDSTAPIAVASSEPPQMDNDRVSHHNEGDDDERAVPEPEFSHPPIAPMMLAADDAPNVEAPSAPPTAPPLVSTDSNTEDRGAAGSSSGPTVPDPSSAAPADDFLPVQGEPPMNYALRYEILPGLSVILSDDAVVDLRRDDAEECSSNTKSSDDDPDDVHQAKQVQEVSVSAKKVCLGCLDVPGCEYIFTGRDVTLRARVVKQPTRTGARNDLDVVAVRGMDVTMRLLELDPFAESEMIVAFLEEYCSAATMKLETPRKDDDTGGSASSIPKRRLTREEWSQFLRNAKRDDRRTDMSSALSPPREVDFRTPNAKVCAVTCKLPEGRSIAFPDCEGTEQCTIRTLLEYYCRAVINTMDDESWGGRNDGVADLTSVKGSIVGAATGAAVLGPIGFLAGSYLGSQLGRKHSASVIGATAGACLFGPVGLIAGVYCGESTREKGGDESSGDKMPDSFGASSSDNKGGLAKAAAKHVSSNKYEYAGTTGVIAGAAAGSVLGPVGMIGGAFLGSVSARKATKSASIVAAEASATEGRQSYKFGDVTRGLINRGKQSRGADTNEGYKFGDLTRGLFRSQRQKSK